MIGWNRGIGRLGPLGTDEVNTFADRYLGVADVINSRSKLPEARVTIRYLRQGPY